MKTLGAHMSVAGGLHLAIERGVQTGCDAIQIFTRNSNQWAAKPIAAEEALAFQSARMRSGFAAVVAHGSYLINLASPDPALRRRSIEAFSRELGRCERLGLDALIAHPGAHMGAGEAQGVRRVARALDRILSSRPDGRVAVLLETTAGQGTSIGHRFEHLRDIIGGMESSDRVGVCIDTCHIFAAGYDLRTPTAYADVMERLDRVVGLRKVRAFHLNDCVKDLGCRVDRHEHIGKGFIGLAGFRSLMNDSRFDSVPMFLETPKGADCAEDRVNLAVLRGMWPPRRETARRGKTKGARVEGP